MKYEHFLALIENYLIPGENFDTGVTACGGRIKISLHRSVHWSDGQNFVGIDMVMVLSAPLRGDLLVQGQQSHPIHPSHL